MIDWGDLVMAPCVALFGGPVLYQIVDGQLFEVNGIFDEAYHPVDPLSIDGMDPSHVTTERSCLGVQLSTFPVPPQQGDLVTVGGAQYYVREVQPDGKGAALLVLNRQQGQR